MAREDSPGGDPERDGGPAPRRSQDRPQRKAADPKPVEGKQEGGRERRRWQRVGADWPISLATPEGRFEARVRDVSQAGVCFFLDRAVPMMTVLAVDLELPVRDGKRLVKARGVVVRCERISRRIDHYEVAVFFNELAQPDRAALAAYVKQRSNGSEGARGDDDSGDTESEGRLRSRASE